MLSSIDFLNKIVRSAFESAGYPSAFKSVAVSGRPDLCQYQCNDSFAAAKEYKKAPAAVAAEVCEKLACAEGIARAEAMAPGFINITLADDCLARLVGAEDEKKSRGEKVIIDYGGPNVAKPLHIGHLRSAIIGEAIKRTARACGDEAIGDIHLGDWGLQMGLVIAGLEEKGITDGFDTETFNEIYPAASARSKVDPEFKAKAAAITGLLQSGDQKYAEIWEKIMKVSVADLKRNYDRLGVSFDCWYGESDAEKYVPKLMEILESKSLLKKSEGAVVVDVSEETDTAPMPPVLVKKTEGANLYATTDLATIIQRREEFSPDELWYVVDNRQALHFEQIFRAARKAELSPGTDFFFYGFGTMNGSDGKPYKTRDGGVMSLSVLLDAVTSAAREKLSASAFMAECSEKEKDETAEKVGMAALKFGDLINHRTKDYIFDLEKFLSFEGKTGPYILYMITRINSILKKEDTAKSFEKIYGEDDRELVQKLLASKEAVFYANEEKAPNYICESAYQIAAAFSKFYHGNKILAQEDREKKENHLALIKLTKERLLYLLDLLGIPHVQSM